MAEPPGDRDALRPAATSGEGAAGLKQGLPPLVNRDRPPAPPCRPYSLLQAGGARRHFPGSRVAAPAAGEHLSLLPGHFQPGSHYLLPPPGVSKVNSTHKGLRKALWLWLNPE